MRMIATSSTDGECGGVHGHFYVVWQVDSLKRIFLNMLTCSRILPYSNNDYYGAFQINDDVYAGLHQHACSIARPPHLYFL